MKGSVRVNGQNENIDDIPTSSSSSSSSSKIEADQKFYDDNTPPSNSSISQILAGVNDDTYRLFIVSLS